MIDSVDPVTKPLAFANGPLRPRSHTFFEELPKDIIGSASFARLAAAVEMRRGALPTAERYLKIAIAEVPADLRATLMLIDALRRQDRAEEARDIARSVDEGQVIGSDYERMHLAMQLKDCGEAARSLALGYEVAANARDNEAVVSVYPNLILLNDGASSVIGDSSKIAPGFWFELEGIECQNVSGLIQASSTPEVTSYDPDQSFAQAILGLGIDEEVTIAPALGAERRYRVKAIQHRYVWLLNIIISTHATRFPQATSMGEMSVKDGDIEPFFDLIRRHEEHSAAIAATYIQLAPPLQALALANNKSVLDIAELIVREGGEIQTCVGVTEERIEAEKFVQKSKGKGAALDTLTVWLAHHLGILPAMKAYFGRLAISQSTFDTILSTRGKAEFNRGQEYMTLGFEGEQKVRAVHTPEHTEDRIRILSDTIDAIKACCEILPVDGTDEIADSDIDKPNLVGAILESVHLALQHNLLLISDDMHLRLWGLRSGLRRMAWLQIVIQALAREKLVTFEDCARATGILALRRHNHLSLDAKVLIELARKDHVAGETLFDQAIHFIAGPNADLRMHLFAVGSFMDHIWEAPIPSWKAGRAIDKLLYRLFQHNPELWAVTFSILSDMLPTTRWNALGRHNLARNYLRDWVNGHFLTPHIRVPNLKRSKSGARRRRKRSA